MAKYSKAKATFIKASNTMRILVSLPHLKLAAGFDVQLARNKAFKTCAYTQAICSDSEEYKHKKAFALLRDRLNEGRSIPMEIFCGTTTILNYTGNLQESKKVSEYKYHSYFQFLAETLVSSFMADYMESVYGLGLYDGNREDDDSDLSVKVKIV